VQSQALLQRSAAELSVPGALPLVAELLRAEGVSQDSLRHLHQCLLPYAGGALGWIDEGCVATSYGAALAAAAEVLMRHVAKSRAATEAAWGPDWGDWDVMLLWERQEWDAGRLGAPADGCARDTCLSLQPQGFPGPVVLPSLTLLGDLVQSCVFSQAPLPRCLLLVPALLTGPPAMVGCNARAGNALLIASVACLPGLPECLHSSPLVYQELTALEHRQWIVQKQPLCAALHMCSIYWRPQRCPCICAACQAAIRVPTLALHAARQLAALGLPSAALAAALSSYRALALEPYHPGGQEPRQVNLAGYSGHKQPDDAMRAALGDLLGGWAGGWG
jgi:hypothetical protein